MKEMMSLVISSMIFSTLYYVSTRLVTDPHFILQNVYPKNVPDILLPLFYLGHWTFLDVKFTKGSIFFVFFVILLYLIDIHTYFFIVCGFLYWFLFHVYITMLIQEKIRTLENKD